jgi:hypothetical protein
MLVTRDFVLVHVPKTGGTFLNGLVKEHCEVVYERTHAPYSDLPADYRNLPALAFVRDPWDWYVSWFEHFQNFGPDTSDDWAYNRFDVALGNFRRSLHACFQWPLDYYSASVAKMSTGCEIGRFEQLREAFVAFLERHHVDAPGLAEAVREAPPSNVGRHRPPRSYYSERDAVLVGRSWAAQQFGYEFLTHSERHARRAFEGWIAAASI